MIKQKLNSFKKLLPRSKSLESLSIYFIGAFLLKGISIITTPIFTRVLSIEGYGIYSIYGTWVSIFAVLIGLQMAGSIPTARIHLGAGAERFDGFIRSILGLSFLTFLVFSFLALMFSSSLSIFLDIDAKLIPYLLINSFGTSCATFYLTYCIQLKKPKKHFKFSVVNTLAIIILSLSLVIYFKSDKYMGRIIGPAIVSVFAIGFVYKNLYFKIKTKISLIDWRYALPLSLPLIIHLMSNLIVGQSDRIIINKFIGYESAAIYSVAYSIGGLGLIIAEITNKSWSPWYLDSTKANKNSLINKVVKLYVLVISLVFIIVILVAPEIFYLMAPKEYSVGITSSVFVTCGVFFQFLYRFPLGYEQYSQRMKWVAIATVISALVNIGLNYYLIPLYGMEGAAIATLISYIVLFIIHELVARKLIKDYNIHYKNYLLGIVSIFLVALYSIYFNDSLLMRYSMLLVVSITYSLIIYNNRKVF